MRRAFASLPLALLFIAYVVPSSAQKGSEVVVRVREGAPLELTCALRVEQRVEWRREGGAMPAELRPAGEAAAPGGLTARLRAAAARPALAGVYACARGPQAQRLRVLVEPADASAPAPAFAAETTAAPAAAPASASAPADFSAAPITYYDVGRMNVSLECPLPNPNKLTYVWSKGNTTVDKEPALQGRYRLDAGGALLVFPGRTSEDDYGNYSCALGDASARLRLHARLYTKLPSANTNVVEGQPLKLVCKVVGRPATAVRWYYSNSSEPGADNATLAADALGERLGLAPSGGIAGAALLVNGTQRSDAGRYTCVPELPEEAARSKLDNAHTTLRVKDMYAALWPFLGICAEVLVLCAVILVYEKRRTKPELDDSDTDNHDQKKS